MQMEVEQLASLALKRKRARGKLHAFPSVQFKMRASKECAREREGERGRAPFIINFAVDLRRQSYTMENEFNVQRRPVL